MSILTVVKDPKIFERLCADLLSAEGFQIDSEPYVDRSGTDILAVEEFRSHASEQTIRVHWRVQCKHYARSGRNLGRKETEEAITSYQATRSPDEGLFLIVSTDYTEESKTVIDRFTQGNPTARVTLWNQRQVVARLERHGEILRRYNLSPHATNFYESLAPLGKLAPAEVLFVSDQSAFAHQLASGLRRAGLSIVFLSPTVYEDHSRLRLVQDYVFGADFRLVVCFLDDTFGRNLPAALSAEIAQCRDSGAGILWFPFLAWSIDRDLNQNLQSYCPVELVDTREVSADTLMRQILSEFRRGDFRDLLVADSFAEDRYTEIDPDDARAPFSTDIKSRFGVSHSFEFLRAKADAEVVWADTSGNPLLVARDSGQGRVAYLNSCCHVCMSSTPVVSPLESSVEFATLVSNTCAWLLGA